MTAGRKIVGLIVAMWFSALPLGRAQLLTVPTNGPDLLVIVRTDISGGASISVWPADAGRKLAPFLSELLHCQDSASLVGAGSNTVECSKALRRGGLALEAEVDLAAIEGNLDPSAGVELWLDCPRLGFESSSMAMMERGGGAARRIRSIRFPAGAAFPPLRFRFGYQRDQLAAIYLPLVALALATMLMAVIMARAGLAALSRSAVLLGTIVWMGAAAQFDAGDPLRILLYGTPLANLAALLVDFWPPFLCIAIGVAIGRRMRAGRNPGRNTGEVLGILASIPLVLTCAVGAIRSVTAGDWPVAAVWLAAAPILLLVRRFWIRARSRSKLVQVKSGELKDRVSAMAARAACPQVKVFVSFSTRSEMANAFAMPGRSIFLTAPLLRSLSKREVDAIAAHELSHFHHSNRSVWMSLGLAMIFCETPARDLLLFWPGGLLVAMLLPITVFFVSLQAARRREFAADAGAAALTSDPRAMISSLAKITRNNGSPNLNWLAEWFSSHPSTRKRIRALAAAARLDPAEVESLCSSDDPGDRYELSQDAGGEEIFTPSWQKVNSGIYGWMVIFSSCGAGLFVAGLLDRWTGTRFGGYGAVQVLAGMALGCMVTKALAAASLSSNYARLRRKLEDRLGVRGQIVGLAIDSEPRLYNGFRFSDAGLLRFERGRLCYRSERIAIALHPADVVEIGTVAASPSNWVRLQPMVRFRRPESGDLQAFILHTVSWLPTQGRLLKSIERWRATQNSTESTSLSGFTPIAGQPITTPTIFEAMRGFRVAGGIALFAAILACLILQAQWRYVVCALVVSAASYAFLWLPAMLYRPPAPTAGVTAPADMS
jgi:heat shock protein HtpX